MLDFTFSETLSSRLERGVKAATDFTAPMRAIADGIRTAAVERFQNTQDAPDGTPWKPSRRGSADGKTLTDRGHLRDSIVAVNDERSALVGTNLVYAAIHQFGSSGSQGVKAHQRVVKQAFGRKLVPPVVAEVMAFQRQMNMPARPFLGFSPVNLVEIEEILSDHLTKALGAGA